MKSFRWNAWNVEHLGKHGILPQEAEYVVEHAGGSWPEDVGEDRHRVLGTGPDGAYLHVVFIFSPPGVVYVIHARLMREAERRRYRRRMR